ncbi:MAG: YjbQ family protein [Ruminococcaceae bacterium]|nr:YjbQ family protein [Oscillospiraceae bacterium]
MGKLREFTIKTEETGVYNITRTVTDAIKESGVESGFAVIFCPHTTAAVAFNENTDPNVGADMLLGMDNAFPKLEGYRHFEGNSDAHIKSSSLGAELIVLIDEGWPLLGIWQNIYFVEFYGPRERKYYIKIVED